MQKILFIIPKTKMAPASRPHADFVCSSQRCWIHRTRMVQHGDSLMGSECICHNVYFVVVESERGRGRGKGYSLYHCQLPPVTCYTLKQLATNSMIWNLSGEQPYSRSQTRNYPHRMQFTLPCSQEIITGPYSKLNKSSKRFSCLSYAFNIIVPSTIRLCDSFFPSDYRTHVNKQAFKSRSHRTK
jgi:hypothetical protein